MTDAEAQTTIDGAQATIDKVRALLTKSEKSANEAATIASMWDTDIQGLTVAVLSLRWALAACAELLVAAVETEP